MNTHYLLMSDKENDIDVQNENPEYPQLDCSICKDPDIQHYFNDFVFCKQCEAFIMKSNGKDPYFMILKELYKDAVNKDIKIKELEQRLMLLEGINITI